MTMVLGQENAETTIDQLEDQGFLIDKITVDPSAKSAQAEHSTPADVASERLLEAN
jgi:hypothetical protein